MLKISSIDDSESPPAPCVQMVVEGSIPRADRGRIDTFSRGWHAARDAYREGIRLSSDERILGSSEFVENVLMLSGEFKGRKEKLRSDIDLAGLVAGVCRYLELSEEELYSRSRRRDVAGARALICYIAVSD